MAASGRDQVIDQDMTPANIDDLRTLARSRLPRIFFDYLDAGSYSEGTMRANIADFDRWGFAPRYLEDVRKRDLSVKVLGRPQRLPIILAPTGLAGMMRWQGEAQAARAASAAGIPLALSNFSVCSVEQVAQNTTSGLHFQLYLTRDRGLSADILRRARAVGVEVLHFTVDANLPAVRERDLRNGFRAQDRLSTRTMWDIATHPRWAMDVLRNGRLPRFGNYPESTGPNLLAQIARMPQILEASPTWDDLDWLRREWPGKLVFKGAMCVDDAVKAVERGADGVVVTNHGGRQMDGTLSSIRALPRIVDAVGRRTTILFDSGIRRGTHIAKALALGAEAVMVGRAYLYGLAADGERGVTTALSLLEQELSIAIGSLGLTGVADLRARGRDLLERLDA